MSSLAIAALVFGALVLASLALPVPRRMWAFALYVIKYIGLGLLEKLRLRRLAAKISGREYEPLSRPRAFRMFCEDMGPTFIKFGQIVGSSAGMFPEDYVTEFQTCLDRVRPFPFDQVSATIRQELGAEADRLVDDIEVEPLASASIAQVHRATLSDGTPVVIKVQRPGLEARISSDMKIMRVMAKVLTVFSTDARLANPVGILEDFGATLREEIDFRQEAQNLDRFNEIMRELGHADVRAPVPHWSLTTRRVVVMELFTGIRVDDVESIHALGIEPERELVKGLRAWFQCVIFYGFFHGDVHAGNLMLLEGGDLGFLDFGIVGRFDDTERRLVTDYIVAFATGDYRGLAKTVEAMGGVGDDVDIDAFAADLERAYEPVRTTNFGDLNIAEMIPTIHAVAREHGMTIPRPFVLIMKQLLYFDRYAKLLAPELNIFTDPRLIMSLMQDIQKARIDAS